MNKTDVIRAWKDPLYRARLTREEIAALPVHPCGLLELEDEQLKGTAGGITAAPPCSVWTFHNLAACCPV
jgi:mersacidin/lichenicidin family type 2 lantibiotic